MNFQHRQIGEKETGKAEPLAKWSKSSESSGVNSRLAISRRVTHTQEEEEEDILFWVGKERKTDESGKEMKRQKKKNV